MAIMGALGEGHKLTDPERAAVIAAYRRLLPEGMALIVGVRAPATHPAGVMAAQARELGADAILLGPHNVQNDAALLEYYRQVSDAPSIPCIIHDYPAMTGIRLSAELIGRIFEASENIHHIKLKEAGCFFDGQGEASRTGSGRKDGGAAVPHRRAPAAKRLRPGDVT
jgi:4-hydroxy-tetrahydrodipicolinate synthase